MDRLRKQLCATLDARLQGRRHRAPDAGAELLHAFIALSRARSHGPHGPNPIRWEAIDAWSRIMRVPIQPQHAEIIAALDDVWMRHAMQRSEDRVKTLPPISEHPLSAGLMDAMIG